MNLRRTTPLEITIPRRTAADAGALLTNRPSGRKALGATNGPVLRARADGVSFWFRYDDWLRRGRRSVAPTFTGQMSDTPAGLLLQGHLHWGRLLTSLFVNLIYLGAGIVVGTRLILNASSEGHDEWYVGVALLIGCAAFVAYLLWPPGWVTVRREGQTIALQDELHQVLDGPGPLP